VTVDNTKLFIPGKATVFIADPNTPMPDGGINAFNLTGPAPDGFNNLGHTSKANTAAFTREGGEKSTIDTWLQDAARTIYSSVAWGLGIPALQIGPDNLNLAFNGAFDSDGGYIVPSSVAPVDKAIVLLLVDGTGKLGFYLPNNSIAIGDAPSFDPTQFMELPISASIQSASEEVIPAVNGVPGLMKIYKTGMGGVAPTVTGALPAGAGTAEPVVITGSGFTGVTGVKFGATSSPYFDFISDSKLTAIVPEGAAGTANIKVSNATGESTTALPYTRG